MDFDSPEYTIREYEAAMVLLAEQILSEETSLLHGACEMWVLANEIDLDDVAPFDFLWAVRSDCAELPMNESHRFGRHLDFLARQDQRLLDTAESYRSEITSMCRAVLEMYPEFRSQGEETEGGSKIS